MKKAREYKDGILHLQNSDMVDFLDPPSSPSKEKSLLNKYIKPYIEALESNKISIHNIKPFANLLKDFSLKDMTPKGKIYYGLINKDDFLELMEFLYNNSGDTLILKCRSFSRADYNIKNIVLNYYAVKFPELMRMITYNFNLFKFGPKLIYNLEKVTEKWVEYINELQQIKNTQNILDINDPADINVNLEVDDPFNFLSQNDKGDLFNFEFDMFGI